MPVSEAKENTEEKDNGTGPLAYWRSTKVICIDIQNIPSNLFMIYINDSRTGADALARNDLMNWW